MNENEMNTQNLSGEQPVMPKMEEIDNNFMEDFLNVEASQQDSALSSSSTENIEKPFADSVISEIEKLEVPKIENIEMDSFNETMEENSFSANELSETVETSSNVENPEETGSTTIEEPTEVGQVYREPLEVKSQKKNHWKFILILFGIVGVFVLLLPLFVKMFGY